MDSSALELVASAAESTWRPDRDHLTTPSACGDTPALLFPAAGRPSAALERQRRLTLIAAQGSASSLGTTLDSTPGVGAAGRSLPTRRLQAGGQYHPVSGRTASYGRETRASGVRFHRKVDYGSAAFLLTPRALWTHVDGLAEVYSPACQVRGGAQ
jgi:hypothetical protein